MAEKGMNILRGEGGRSGNHQPCHRKEGRNGTVDDTNGKVKRARVEPEVALTFTVETL